MYAKVFRQMYDGTLATNGPWEALVTFQQMLVLSNDQGQVDMTAAAISRTTTIPLNIIEKGIGILCAPDPESRTPDCEGRRLVRMSEGRSWGWQIVNFMKYRALQREADRRDYHRAYYHEKRKAKAFESVESQPVSTASTASTDTEADTEAEERISVAAPPHPKPKARVHGFPPGFDTFWAAYPRKVGKDKAAKAFAKRKPDSALLSRMLMAIAQQASSSAWTKDAGQFIPHPSTWLNEGRWQDDEASSRPDWQQGAI